MAIYLIPKAVQKLWDEWNIRGVLLFSLFLQILLILLAGSRRRTRNTIITGIIWLAYLMADAVAIFGIGLIANNLNSEYDKGGGVSKNVAAFWAPFLLLHLGGPDSITAFSIEDNELWTRHLFGLISEVSVVVYVVFLVIPNPFWIPSVLVYFAGTIKYGERTIALYQACWGNLKNSVEMRHLRFLSFNEGINDGVEEINPAGNGIHDGVEEIKLANLFYFKVLRLLVANNISMTPPDSDFSQNVFKRLDSQSAFKMMEVELNFMYDELFTKMAMVHRSRGSGYFLRLICTGLISAAFLVFTLCKKPKIPVLDIFITYTLLVGAMILDVVALFNLTFSDWTIAIVTNSSSLKVLNAIKKKISFPGGRWCKKIYQYNFIDQCMKEHSSKWADSVLKNFQEFPHIKYDTPDHSKRLQDIIFYHIMNAAEDRSIEGYFDRSLIVRRRDVSTSKYVNERCNELGLLNGFKYLLETMGYDESILIWHIATDYLYYKSKESNNNAKAEVRETCKILSNYLIYLLEMGPDMMPPKSAFYQVGFNDAHSILIKFLKDKSGTKQEMLSKIFGESSSSNGNSLFAELLEEQNLIDGIGMLLKFAYEVAKKLENIDIPGMGWEILEKVWLDLLCYGAGNCSIPIEHAKQLAKGGELITFVWLLLAHFGLHDICVARNRPQR